MYVYDHVIYIDPETKDISVEGNDVVCFNSKKRTGTFSDYIIRVETISTINSFLQVLQGRRIQNFLFCKSLLRVSYDDSLVVFKYLPEYEDFYKTFESILKDMKKNKKKEK